MTEGDPDSGRISRRALIGYGLAGAPPQFMYVIVLMMYLKFAVDDLGASAAAIGGVFLFAKLWDAVSDPLVGYLSDRTRGRLGRRRSWILASAPFLFIFGLMAWAPPADLEGVGLIAWISVAIFGFYTAYTAFDVPHMALGAEMTFDRQQRNQVFGTRQVIRTLGMFAAATGGVMLVQQGRSGAAWMALGVGVATLILVTGGMSVAPRERSDFIGRGGDNPMRAIRDVMANPHARLLLFVFFIESIGQGGIGVLSPFIVEYVIGMPKMLPVLLGTYMVCALLAVPMWVRLGRTIEKRRLWLFALVLGGFGYGLVFWVGEGDWLLMAVSGAIAGAAGACGNTLGQALKAEVIDFDEYRTGERKEGVYFAGWSFMSKLAGGLMIGVVGVALQWSGYIDNAAEQAPLVKNTMLWMMGGIPLVGYSVAAIVFSRFSLTEREHALIRHELDQRALDEQG